MVKISIFPRIKGKKSIFWHFKRLIADIFHKNMTH